MKGQWKGFILGVLSCAMIIGGTAYASGGSSQIEVYFKSIRYMFDGVEKKPTSGQGFIYNGTTYVPLRFMSEAMGKDVKWESESSTVWVGKQPEAAPVTNTDATYISDMELTKSDEAHTFLSIDKWGITPMNTTNHTKFTINGKTYTKGLGIYHHDHAYPPHIKAGGNVEVSLDGKYKKLSGYVGADTSSLKDTASGTITIYGDGNILKTYSGLTSKKDAEQVDVDVTGIKKLVINFNSNRNGLINLLFADAAVQ